MKSGAAWCRLRVKDGRKRNRRSTKRREEHEMLPLEVIGVLGLLYVFFMVGTIKALRAKSAVRRPAKIREKRLVRRIAREAASRTV